MNNVHVLNDKENSSVKQDNTIFDIKKIQKQLVSETNIEYKNNKLIQYLTWLIILNCIVIFVCMALCLIEYLFIYQFNFVS